MIECIFTIDYEIYGNGQGSLKELVYKPAERLIGIFQKFNARFVNFVEVAEIEMIESKGTDKAIGLVKRQLRDLYRDGFELGLHLHPQWYKARYENGRWILDYSEYNLCTLAKERIIQIIGQSIDYLRQILGIPDFTPVSFRAGNWLFQPSQTLANILAEQGMKVDSSVFKGGLQHQRKLDYRPSLKNGYFWRFTDDVNIPDSRGVLIELPIYTQMVPFWKMITSKRVGLQRKAAPSIQENNNHNEKKRKQHLMNFMRFKYPLKLDFCRMTIDELTQMMDKIIKDDRQDPKTLRPVVAIGHTKDLVDFETVESFLSYLREKGIKISTFQEVYPKVEKCLGAERMDSGGRI